MKEEERYQIKGALLKCAEENENKSTFTGNIVVSSICKSAVERIEELEKEYAKLEKENAELKQYAKALEETDNTNILHCMKVNGKLYKAKKIIRNCLNLWNNVMTEETVRAFIKEAEQFLNSEVEQ